MRISPHITIDESEIREAFILGSGPGGQNINKVATGVQLRFNVIRSPSLPEDVRRRLAALAGKRISSSGDLIIESRAYRSQRRNRLDARQKLLELVQQATRKPKSRKETHPTIESKKRRLAEKSRRSETKKSRQRVDHRELD